VTPEAFEASARAILDRVRTLTLATCRDGAPWATDVWFAPDGFDLFFYSRPDSRHCRNLAAHAACAATVHVRADTWKDIRGLQMEGHAREAEGMAAKARSMAAWARKYPFAAELFAGGTELAGAMASVRAHVFRPTSIRLVDNARGFGQRIAMRLEEGRLTGLPGPDEP